MEGELEPPNKSGRLVQKMSLEPRKSDFMHFFRSAQGRLVGGAQSQLCD
jgi:hypothetical protein